jgi:hypothetical protein
MARTGDVVNAMKQIALTKGYITIVDDEDFDKLNQYKWQYHNGYAARYAGTGRQHHRRVFMHNELLYPPDGMQVDHANLNKLDNRRCNLRLCTRSQNLGNVATKGGSSQHKGVYYVRRDGKWAAMIQVNRTRVWLGQYDDEVTAAQAYDDAARKYFGEFARYNFPSEDK